MITISHLQARRLLQSQLDDRKIPDEQWAALQVHLEECAGCRAYRDRLALTERGIRRAARKRWDAVEGPAPGIAQELTALFRERKEVRRTGFWMVGSAVVFLLAVIWFVAWAAHLLSGATAAPAARVNPVTATPLPTPTRTAAFFNGVVAYEVRAGQDGSNGEIYLLNPGTVPENLTHDPANDHAPAWSPDGQWLAFLSNRTGKDEVYVMHISGTRLTRLTDLPDVSAFGPLSWSADGQMLSFIGERTVGGWKNNWVYIVPLDGSNAYSLGGSAGATWAAFSPAKGSRQLAIANAVDWPGRLVVYNFDPAREGFLAIDRPVTSPSTVPEETQVSVDRFDWSADGERLLFKKSYAAPSNVTGGMLTQADLRWVDMSGPQSQSSLSSRAVISGVPPSDFPEFSWTGIQDEIAFLEKSSLTQTGAVVDSDCQILRLGTTRQSLADMTDVTALCIEAGLEQANWRTAQKSVLVIGREPGHPEERGLYLLRFQGDTAQANWLADARNISGPPRLRPVRSPLAIDPHPVRPAAALP